MAHNEKILNQTIGPRTSHSDITRVLQQKVVGFQFQCINVIDSDGER